MSAILSPTHRPFGTALLTCAALAIIGWQTYASTRLTFAGVRQGPGWHRLIKPPRHAPLLDFYQEWGSARNWYTGLPIYSSHETTVPHHLPDGPHDYFVNWNAHPPTTVLFVLPVGLLSYGQALVVWNAFSMACFVLGLWLFGRGVGCAPSQLWRWLLPGLAILSLWEPFRDQATQGQLTALLFLLLVGTWYAARRNRLHMAGLFLGFAITLKLFPCLLFLYFAMRKQWRVLGSATLTVAVLTLLTIGVFGWSVYVDYVTTVLPTLKSFRSSVTNQSLVGVWHRLFVGEPRYVTPYADAPWLAWLGTGMSAASFVGLSVLALWRARTVAQYDRCFWLFALVMVLVGPLSWSHSQLLWTPVLLYGVYDVQRSHHRRRAWWLLGPVVLLTFVDLRQTIAEWHALGTISFPITPVQGLLWASLPWYAMVAMFIVAYRGIHHRCPTPITGSGAA